MSERDLFGLHPGAVLGASLARTLDQAPAARDAVPEPRATGKRPAGLSGLGRLLTGWRERALSRS